MSSPLRKRWTRTPPVARPFTGYSSKAVTFAVPGAVPGKAPFVPAMVTTTAAGVVRANGTEVDHFVAGRKLDAGHATGRTSLGGRTLEALNRSNWACRVTKTRSTLSSCAGSTASTESLSFRAMISQSSRFSG